jgi:rhodanese-related sulfurtransferase
VAALRNGTIGWTLAGLALAHGESRRFGPVSQTSRAPAARAAQALAERAGVLRLDATGLARWRADASRTLYCWDVRTAEEYEAGHLPGFGSAPGGQLVQETDVFAAVRGARIVLADGGDEADGTRAAITAHWLAQMGWAVAWLGDVQPAHFTEHGPWQPAHAPLPLVPLVSPAELAAQLNLPGTLLLDFASSAQHVRAHVPGAHWALRAQLGQWLPALALPAKTQVVCTCPDGRLARLAAADIAAALGRPVAALAGGTAAWGDEGRTLMASEASGASEAGGAHLLSPRIDRYRRPYEGTDAPRQAMQAYLDWEFGLVEQLGRDNAHHFQVLAD